MLKKQLLILLIIFSSQHSLCFLTGIFSLFKLSWNIGLLANDLSTMHDAGTKIESAITGDKDEEVMKKLVMIDEKIDHFLGYTRDKLNHIGALINSLPDEIQIRTTKKNIEEFMVKTNEKWDTFIGYVKNRGSKHEYEFLADTIIEYIGEKLSTFRNNITPLFSTQSGLFMLLANIGNDKRSILCNKGETYHDTIARFYQIVLLTEVKAHNLLSFAYRVKFPGNRGNVLLESVKNSLKEQFPKYMEAFKRSLTSMDMPYLRACEPKQSWRRGEDFHELEQYAQRTVTYRGNQYIRQPSLEEMLNLHSGCPEELRDDWRDLTLTFKGTEVCLWSDGPYRVRWVRNGGELIGMEKGTPCPEKDLYWYDPWGFGPHRKFYECICFSEKWKFAAFMTEANVTENYVVVGLRLNIYKNYVYIQVAQGKLEANGYIANYSWIQPEEMEWPSWNEGTDYHLTRRHEMSLCDIKVSPGFLVTGASFARLWTGLETRFFISIRARKFNYTTGKLNSGPGEAYQCTTPEEWRRLEYPRKNPIFNKPLEPYTPDSEGFTYLKFSSSSRESDFEQSTIPLLDAAPIVTNPLSPIGGVGIFHKGRRDDAGLVSLRLFPISYTYFVDTFSATHDLSLNSTWVN